MDIRHSVNLLTTSIVAILLLLALLAGYSLSTATAPATGRAASVISSSPGSDPVNEQVSVGKKIWNKNACGACHSKNMTVDATGPALAGVTSRWADYPRTDLYAWVRNNPKLTASGHPRAVEVTAAYPGAMTVFPNLTDEDIEALLAYIERP